MFLDLLGPFLIPEHFVDPLPCVYDHIVSNISVYVYIYREIDLDMHIYNYLHARTDP